MTRTWGFAPMADSVCGRCNYEQCICGDFAFELWMQEERSILGGVRRDAQHKESLSPLCSLSLGYPLCKPECTIVFYILTNPMYGGVHERSQSIRQPPYPSGQDFGAEARGKGLVEGRACRDPRESKPPDRESISSLRERWNISKEMATDLPPPSGMGLPSG